MASQSAGGAGQQEHGRTAGHVFDLRGWRVDGVLQSVQYVSLSLSRLGSLALLSGAALREYATSLQNFAAAMRLSPRDPARGPMMPQSDAGMDNQLCFKLMRGQSETSEVVRENVPARGSRGVEGC